MIFTNSNSLFSFFNDFFSKFNLMDFNFKKNNLAFVFFTFLLLSSCSSFKQDIDKKEKPLVLTTFTILADIARNIAGDRLLVHSITKVGAEVHGYQPTPSDLVKASKADLIVENGLGLELWARKFTKSAGNVPTIVLSEGMKPLLIEGDSYAGKPNPHAWMSPLRTIHYIDNLVEGFIELDPSGRKIYMRNAISYKARLLELDKELRRTLSKIPINKKVLVTCEGAFSYLTHDYGMDEAYLWPVNAESQVTPKRMLNLINVIKERKIPTIFCESTVSAKAQIEVARSSGAAFGGTFYVDSLSSKDGPAPTLFDLQRHNLRLIQKGLESGISQNQ